MNSKLLCHVAAAVSAIVFNLALVAPAHAQTKAALVQNVDEPGRSPYQELVYANSDSVLWTFSAVPAGMRLVVTHANVTIETICNTPPGTIPRVFLRALSSNNINVAPLLTLPVERGTVVANRCQMIADRDIVAYFGPGEKPRIDSNLYIGTSESADVFLGTFPALLSGYYIRLP